MRNHAATPIFCGALPHAEILHALRLDLGEAFLQCGNLCRLLFQMRREHLEHYVDLISGGARRRAELVAQMLNFGGHGGHQRVASPPHAAPSSMTTHLSRSGAKANVASASKATESVWNI